MKDLKRFFKSIPLFIWIVFFALILIICCLPSILIRPGRISFAETGQIGDTIGGIMGPFIAIVAALLTFVAFWVQYEANNNQRKDIAIERHEAKFYKMLDIYSSITNGLEVHGIKGKEAFAELVGEFAYTFCTLDEIYSKILCDKNRIEKLSTQIESLIEEFNTDRDKYNVFITNLSYNLFFYGKHYMIVDFEHPERTGLGEEIKKIAFNLNQTGSHRRFSDFAKAGDFDMHFPELRVSNQLYEGHSDFLGHYFRHLFQMVKYVSSLNDSLFDEETKSGYVKMLRSQMSDYEQILLYYNSLTEQGAAWNKTYGSRFPQDAGYISRFRMIKNLPPNFPMFGVLPYEMYKEDAQKWEKLGKKFYEHKCLPITKRIVNMARSN